MVTPTLVKMRLNRVKFAFSLNENLQAPLQVKYIKKFGKNKELNSLQEFFCPESFQHLSPE